MRKKRLLDILSARYPKTGKKTLHARILAGSFIVDGERICDPAFQIEDSADITEETRGYVSRGGEKLEKALRLWMIDTAGKVFLDAGASTGGFTDCLLKFGAQCVHAVDVAYGQLDFSLRRNPKVIVYERTNISTLRSLQPAPHAAVADLSFRSLRGAAAHILTHTREKECIALVKPQFEWRDPPAEFDGVVRRREDAASILTALIADLYAEGLFLKGITSSPIKGRKGNSEFFFYISGLQGLERSEIGLHLAESLGEAFPG
jgi:23S rRNA (cytidine1920-2'-O)/16S rRNA (cytidine1409-2'-O)-methyltransferase